jgi:ubiquinone/menaquinone biosynthesis C-methylase UbiE
MDQVRRAYGGMAERYIEAFGTIAQVHGDDLALIARHLSVRPGTVLDVGCGPGHLTDHLRSLDVEATGIDQVPEFIDNARTSHPNSRYVVGSMDELAFHDSSVAGILAWYSLIHLPPENLDGVLAELRRVMAPGSPLVAGFFDGDRVAAFEHNVMTAYYWPVDQLSKRLQRAGFTEVERQRRPGSSTAGVRPHAAIAAIAG